MKSGVVNGSRRGGYPYLELRTSTLPGSNWERVANLRQRVLGPGLNSSTTRVAQNLPVHRRALVATGASGGKDERAASSSPRCDRLAVLRQPLGAPARHRGYRPIVALSRCPQPGRDLRWLVPRRRGPRHLGAVVPASEPPGPFPATESLRTRASSAGNQVPRPRCQGRARDSRVRWRRREGRAPYGLTRSGSCFAQKRRVRAVAGRLREIRSAPRAHRPTAIPLLACVCRRCPER
jgi:hypothetical protein